MVRVQLAINSAGIDRLSATLALALSVGVA
jgi:hypothetical protein